MLSSSVSSSFSLFIFGIFSILLFLGSNHPRGVNGGNIRPYWVSVTGFQGAGSVGQDAGANGYAGSSLVSPLASDGFNSPLTRYIPRASYQGDSFGAGFGGFGHQRPGTHSAPVAGGQGELPSAAYAAGRR